MFSGKIFCIGFHKTGTTTLDVALETLGYSVCHAVEIDNPNIASEAESIAFGLVEKFDAFQDNPWPILYKELDAKFPGSRFILTVRPANDWIKSVVDHFGTTDTPMRSWIYGVGHPVDNEPTYLRRYDKHNWDVVEYFQSRPSDLLIMRITDGDGWEKLCSFLERPVPGVPFPHRNKVTDHSPTGHGDPAKDIRRGNILSRAFRRLGGSR